MINRDTPIIDILRSYPQTQAVFKKYGMNCSGCMGASLEKIENGAKSHGLLVDELLKELNECAEKKLKGDRGA